MKHPWSINPASWVIKEISTGEVLFETYNKQIVDALNVDKYHAVPIYDYLVSINGQKAHN